MDEKAESLKTLFETIVKPLPEATMLISDKGKIVSANHAALRLLQNRHENVCGHALTHQVFDDEDKIVKYLKNCSRAGDLVVGSLTWRGLNGESIPFRSEGAALRHSLANKHAFVLLRLIPKGSQQASF